MQMPLINQRTIPTSLHVVFVKGVLDSGNISRNIQLHFLNKMLP